MFFTRHEKINRDELREILKEMETEEGGAK